MSSTTGAGSTATHDPFFTVPTTTANISVGPVELPFRIYDATSVIAFFPVPYGGVEAMVSGMGLVPALRMRGRAMVAVATFQYRDTTVGPYNEVGVVIPVYRTGEEEGLLGWTEPFRRADRRRQGAFVVDLPVTTDEANAAGREIWGYPKFVTSIGFELRHGRFDTTVGDPEGAGSIMRLSGKTGVGVPGPGLDIVLYSFLDEQMLRANVDTRGAYRVHPLADLQLTVGETEHPMATRLRQLGLDNARPRAVLTHTHFRARLNAGVPLTVAA